jgi:ABC-2 type transport system ATP-binding protein
MNNENGNDAVVEIAGLHKSFGDVRAVDGVDLTVGRGHIVGLLGANGCGKTTLMRHLIGHCLPDEGTCRTLGCDTADLGANELSRIGYVHQEGRLLGWLKVQSMIDYVAAYYPNWDRAMERQLMEQAKLTPDARVSTLSPGQRQRLSVILALCFHPELLILDEPAAGMDPLARIDFLELLVTQLQDENRTILISSHILSDVEKIMDQVVILDAGKVLRDCSLDELRGEFTNLRIVSPERDLPETLPLPGIVRERRERRQAEVIVQRLDQEALNAFVRESGSDVQIGAVPLDECYRHVVEGGTTGGAA